ncbi:hypothetical protein GOBAR_DD16012 [Gossypium barbadense]|nr:hypothetical protein GOBAR_DD16012 [Gossypium barbadense]
MAEAIVNWLPHAFVLSKTSIKRRRFGFIRFSCMEDARRAIWRMNDCWMFNNQLTVNLFKPLGYSGFLLHKEVALVGNIKWALRLWFKEEESQGDSPRTTEILSFPNCVESNVGRGRIRKVKLLRELEEVDNSLKEKRKRRVAKDGYDDLIKKDLVCILEARGVNWELRSWIFEARVSRVWWRWDRS